MPVHLVFELLVKKINLLNLQRPFYMVLADFKDEKCQVIQVNLHKISIREKCMHTDQARKRDASVCFYSLTMWSCQSNIAHDICRYCCYHYSYYYCYYMLVFF